MSHPPLQPTRASGSHHLSDLALHVAHAETNSIATLTTAMTRGDEDAWREFHRQYFDRLFRYQIVLQRGDEDQAAELVQQTILRVVRHVRPFADETVFWSWLTCLGRCTAADDGRSQSRRLRLFERFAHAQELRKDGHQQISSRMDALEHCLSTLPPDDRALIEGKYYERLNYATLAEQFDTSAKAIESRLARLRKKMRDAMDAHTTGAPS